MQVQVIHAPCAETFEVSLYPEQHPANNQYILNQWNHFSDTLTEIGRKFAEDSRKIYEVVNSSQAVKMAKAALRVAKGIFHPNQIRPLETLEDCMTAQPVMQRWIMTMPELRQLYHEQRIDGYSDTYVDLEPKKVGEEHYDYRRVMDGMVQEIETDSGESTWMVKSYCEDLSADDRELEFSEKCDIVNTWDLLREFMKSAKDDPTNIFGGDRG